MASGKFAAAACVATAVLAFGNSAWAEETGACAAKVTRANVARCAVAVSPSVRSEAFGVEALRGRERAAGTWLPSNPNLVLTASRRTGPGGQPEAFNWNAGLSQEVEIGGQRGRRLEAATAQLTAQEQRVLVARREVAAAAWIAYYDVLAAEEGHVLAVRLSSAATGLAVLARARADQGLSSAIEADIAEANTTRFVRVRFEQERRLTEARARLAVLLGVDPASTPAVEGDLVPLSGVEEKARSAIGRMNERPEVRAAEAEREAFESRAALYRRSRIPNPLVSVFVQNDGFNERVFGVGLTLPIPVPAPIGRTYAGEITETGALARRAGTETDRVRRDIGLTLVTSLRELESRRREVDAVTPEQVDRAERGVQALAQEIGAGRLNVRDALFAQQALVELLQARLAARHALCVASVQLARAAGIPLDGDGT